MQPNQASALGICWSMKGLSLGYAKFMDAKGERVLAVDPDGISYIWSVEGTAPTRTIAHSLPVSEVVISKGGDQILTGSSYGTVSVWNATTGQADMQVYQKGGVRHVQFLDEATVMAFTGTGVINLWDITSGVRKMRFTRGGGPYDPDAPIQDNTFTYAMPAQRDQSDIYTGEIVSVYGWG